MTTIRLFMGWLSVLILAVSVVPLVPLRFAPDLGALGLTLVLVTSDDRAVVRWVVWVGFGLELLSPAHFGLGWLGLLLSGLIGLELRRRFSMPAAPWVWPGWFAGLTLVAISPVVLSVHAWPVAGPVILATTGWGTLLALLVQWFRDSHPVVGRSSSGSVPYGTVAEWHSGHKLARSDAANVQRLRGLSNLICLGVANRFRSNEAQFLIQKPIQRQPPYGNAL